jgi:hypothetical protein
MGRPPSKIHDPIGYDNYYSGNTLLGSLIIYGLLIGGGIFLITAYPWLIFVILFLFFARLFI